MEYGTRYITSLETGRRIYPKPPFPATPVNSASRYPFYITSDYTEQYGIVFTFPARNMAEALRIWEAMSGRMQQGKMLPQFRKCYSGAYGARKMAQLLDGLDIHYVDIRMHGKDTVFFLREDGTEYADIPDLAEAVRQLVAVRDTETADMDR
jgi:hypothetical protein